MIADGQGGFRTEKMASLAQWCELRKLGELTEAWHGDAAQVLMKQYARTSKGIK